MLNGHRLSVLMYHAVSGPGVGAGDADPHYTVTGSQFTSHLRAIRSADTLAIEPTRNAQEADGWPLPVADAYVRGEEVRGAPMNDLLALCWLASTGWNRTAAAARRATARRAPAARRSMA